MKTKAVAEYGDFQTPKDLAQEVCRLLAAQGVTPASIVEPTCGLGSFLIAGLESFPSLEKGLGLEINAEYVEKARAALEQKSYAEKAQVLPADFFAVDWEATLDGLPEPILVLGNLPWVTNAHLEILGSQNLPKKKNFQGRAGLDAITGKANFDISEWMLIRLLEALNGRRGILAMLIKSAVARKTLHHAWKHGMQVERSAIYRIDAGFHFDAAVDSALLVTHFAPTAKGVDAKVYTQLNEHNAPTVIGYENGAMFANLDAYHRCKHLAGEQWIKWRSGIKHDCSKVMELRRTDGKYRNGLGEWVELEDEYLFPMLKSSGVAKGCSDADVRWMLVPQRAVGQEATEIKDRAPQTWAYLERHAELLARRGSSIYRNQPRFSIFGVGDYSFAPWKVAISGFYKRLTFASVGPFGEKSVVFDDTSYFLPCRDETSAGYLAGLLNSDRAKEFYNAFVFWDAKRPITAELLRRLDLSKLARELGSADTFERHFGQGKGFAAGPKRRGAKRKARGASERTLDFVEVLP